jgi:hypothetical protein
MTLRLVIAALDRMQWCDVTNDQQRRLASAIRILRELAEEFDQEDQEREEREERGP